MENSKRNEEIVLKHCLSYQLNRVKYICKYKGWLTYNVSSDALEGGFCGYPRYVFLREDLRCRFANEQEVSEIMNIEAKKYSKS